MHPDGRTVFLDAVCKINVFLHITGRLESGYHTLESFILPLSEPHDILHVTPSSKGGLRLTCSDTTLEGQDNILVKAYEAFARATSFAPGLDIFLEKNIPYGAGLGGGSSDAATLLLYLNESASKVKLRPLPDGALVKLAAALGADVPFFLQSSPVMMHGIGDILEPVKNPLQGLHLVLVCPRLHVATAWAFAAWDEKNTNKLTAGSLTNPGEKDSSALVRGMCVQNDLGPVVFDKYPELHELIMQLYDLKADAASMSGSGSSVFGLFTKGSAAKNAAEILENAGERVFHHIL